MPGVAVLASADLITNVKFHNAIFNTDHIDVGRIARAVIFFYLPKGFTLVFRGFLLENRIQVAGKQQRIHRLPHPVPVLQWTIFHIGNVKYTFCRLLLFFRQRLTVIVVPMRQHLATYQ